MGQNNRETLSRHFEFPFAFASASAARWEVVLGVRLLVFALNSKGQLFMMRFSWADDFFRLDNRRHFLEPELINGFVVDHVANPDFAHARTEQFPYAAIDF